MASAAVAGRGHCTTQRGPSREAVVAVAMVTIGLRTSRRQVHRITSQNGYHGGSFRHFLGELEQNHILQTEGCNDPIAGAEVQHLRERWAKSADPCLPGGARPEAVSQSKQHRTHTCMMVARNHVMSGKDSSGMLVNGRNAGSVTGRFCNGWNRKVRFY